MPEGSQFTLTDDKAEEVATALGGSEAEETSTPAAPSGGTEAGTETTPESTTPATEAGGNKDVQGGEEAEPKGPIPYERFREVNEKAKTLMAERAEWEKKLADSDTAARTQATEYLIQVAKEHPELRPIIYGKEQAAAMDAEAAKNPPPENPVERKVWELEKSNAEMQRRFQAMERQSMLDDLQGRCESAMEKFAEFKDPKIRKIGERLIAQSVLADRTPPEKVVENVALEIREFVEGVKAGYKTAKVTTAKAAPVGAGNGGAAPPGTPPRKLSLEDGSLNKAVVSAMKGIWAE